MMSEEKAPSTLVRLPARAALLQQAAPSARRKLEVHLRAGHRPMFNRIGGSHWQARRTHGMGMALVAMIPPSDPPNTYGNEKEEKSPDTSQAAATRTRIWVLCSTLSRASTEPCGTIAAYRWCSRCDLRYPRSPRLLDQLIHRQEAQDVLAHPQQPDDHHPPPL